MTRASVVVLLVMAAACGKQPTGGDGGGGAGGGGSGGGGGMAPCTAPRIMCRGLCIDTSTDPADCGSCDHQCSANVSCVGGICGVPVALVSGGPTSARGPIVTDGADVYFSNFPSVCNVTASCQSIAKCSVAGCSNPFAFASPESTTTLAIDGGVVYWALGTTVRGCATSGQCAMNSATTIANVGASVVAANAHGVYFVTSMTGVVSRCPLGGCGGASPTMLGTTTAGSTALAADGTHVFFGTPTQILSAPDDGSTAATTLVSGLTGVQFLAVDGSNVYYTTTTGEIGSCAKSGCTQPTPIASAPITITGFVTDGASVFWSLAGTDGTILRCPTSGTCGTPVVLARLNAGDNHHIYGIAVDGTNVYYTVGPAVMRTLK